MRVEILYITCNRLDYTKKNLPTVIENAGMPIYMTMDQLTEQKNFYVNVYINIKIK